ncbi:carbohydrate ABC transporter permease [Bifidobacterium choloepi]|uniref:Sugar ABC transporter permease n=1 Tax=Bifidobacterium choloepi TaxID=2614131 RepID=A0A6I5N7Q6_9BIFI|nr:sugar ABC transporter permease [Bifidobacterium choloepi]NEG69881.1 sugar ABC transporter permease [Bifidobacterium choloepi]
MTVVQSRAATDNWRTRLGRFEWKASPYLYVAPFFLLFAVVGLFPLLYTMYIATRQYNTLTGDSGVAICGATCGAGGADASIWANFQWVLHQHSFWIALRNSFSIFLLSTVPQMILALFLAWVLNANLKARTFWRMGVLLPYVVAPSAAGIIFSQIFSDKMGVINVALSAIGLQPIMWHASAFWSHVAIATIVNFRWTGYNSLILLAAMQAIPDDVMEAAVVDGAGKWRTFWSVTLPMLRPTLIFVIITSTIGGLQIFDEPQMFHNGTSGYGGPNGQYLTLSLYLWDMGFNKVTIGQPNLGRAAAVAWLLFLIIVAIAVLNFFLTQWLAAGSHAKTDRARLAEYRDRQRREYESAKRAGLDARQRAARERSRMDAAAAPQAGAQAGARAEGRAS